MNLFYKKLIIALLFCSSSVFINAQQAQLIIPESHEADALTITPDEQWMVSISGKNIKVWNYKLAKLIKNISVAAKAEQSYREYSPITSNNNYAAFQILDSIYILSLKDFNITRAIKIDGRRTVLAFAPDGEKIYMAGFKQDEYNDIILQDLDFLNGKPNTLHNISVKNVGTHSPTEISFSPDKTKLLLSDRVAGGWIVNIATKSLIKSFTKSSEPNPYIFLPDGNILAFTGVSEKNLSAVILDGSSHQPVKKSKIIFNDEYGVSAVEHFNGDYHRKSNKILLSYQTKSVLLNVKNLAVEKKFDKPGDYTFLLTGNANTLFIGTTMSEHDLGDDEPKRIFGTKMLESFMQHVFTHTSGVVLKDRTITIENGEIYMRVFKDVNFDDALYRVTNDGNTGFAYSDKNGLNKFDPWAAIPKFENISKVSGWGKSFAGMQVFDKQGLITLIGDDGVYVMDLKTYKLLYIVDIPFGMKYYLMEGLEKYCDISPDKSKMILYAHIKDADKSKISCVDLSKKEEIWNYESAEIKNLRFTDEGSTLIFTSNDSLLTLNAANGQKAKAVQILPSIYQTAIAPSNKIAATKIAYYENYFAPGDIGIYSIKDNKQLGTIKGTGAPFHEFAFLKNERYFVTNEEGGICIWDAEKMRQLGKLFLFDKSDQWVFLSPDGRFDATPQAMKEMYYTRGAEIIPLESLYEKYYTPGLLKQIWNNDNAAPVPNIDNIKSPPKVEIAAKQQDKNLTVEDEITTIKTDQERVTIVVKGDGVNDKVTEMRLYQNEKLVQTTRNLVVEDETTGEKIMTRQFELNLTKGNNTLKAIAINTQRTESIPALLNIEYKPKEAIKPEENTVTLHMLIVGLNNYKNPKYNLNYAQADAKAFESAIKKGTETLFQKTSSITLFDGDATKAKIAEAFQSITASAKPNDFFVFYYAGHGVINDKKQFYLVPHDVTQLYGNDGALAQKGFSAEELQEFSKNIKAQKQLYVLDACQSAGAFETVAQVRGAAEEKAIAQLARATGTQWLTASGSEQFASEFEQLGHGTFTYCLLEGFKGEADNGDKKLTVKELDAYLQDKVPEVTKKYKGTPQYPSSYGYGNDFPLIIIK